ncbi:MAG: hypothetical protein EU549_00140 [Promethearchaeota archaeon]|nr:MAG: hypothetical protein EU549_00140 [Candidatus Lokiarchaeota archaeon]
MDLEDKSTLDKEIERYARQILIEEWDQDRLSNASVFIAGIGALGTIVALNLALMGVNKLVLCDYDTIEMSNLSRQVLFFEEDIGDYKVEAAKKNLKHFNPNIRIDIYKTKLQKLNKQIFEEVDVIIDGLDTFESRRWLNSLAIDIEKPLIHGGLFGWFGNVQIVIPKKTACLECQPLIPRKRLQKPCTPLGEVRRKERKIDKEVEEKIPSILTTSSIIAGIQSQLAIKIILGLDLPKENYIFYDGLSESFTKMKLNRNENCIVCSDKYHTRGVEFAISKNDSVRNIKDRLIMTYDLEEPFNLMFKGKILEDNKRVKDLNIENKDSFFIWNKNIIQPMKFYAVLTEKVKPIVITIPKDTQIFELKLKWGTITDTKRKIRNEAEKQNQEVEFFKTQKLKKGLYLVRYKKYRE